MRKLFPRKSSGFSSISRPPPETGGPRSPGPSCSEKQLKFDTTKRAQDQNDETALRNDARKSDAI
jgi:hypothetical protein